MIVAPYRITLMSLFDGILHQVSSHADVANLAVKLGIEPEMAERR